MEEDFRSFEIIRIPIIKGRTVGSLGLEELQALSSWMERVSDRWKGVDEEIKRHFLALQQRMIELGMSKSWPSREIQEGAQLQESNAPPQQQRFVLPTPPLQSNPEEIPISQLRLAPISRPSVDREEPQDAQTQIPEPTVTAVRRDETRTVVEQVFAEQPEELSAPQKETSGEPVSDEAVESQLPGVFKLQTREDVMWELQRLGPGLAQDRVLETLELANAVLRQATHFDQARQLSDVAEVLAACAQKLDMAQAVQDEAVAFAIRSEHRYNEVLQAARKRGEIAASVCGHLKGRKSTGEPNFTAPSSGLPKAHAETFEGSERNLEETFEGSEGHPEKTARTLAQIGIDKSRAKRLHRWTGISSEELERRIEEKRGEGKLTKSAVLSDSSTPKNEPKPYQPLLSFLKDLQRNPQNYDLKILVSDPELTTAYGQVRARFLGLVEKLEPNG
jgi:hypothetical protein